MQTKDHLALGSYMADIFDINNPVCRKAFVFGNIMPDLNKLSYIRGYFQLLAMHTQEKIRRPLSLNDHRRMLIGGHTAEGSCFFVNRTYRLLKKKECLSVYDYYRLGKAVHYLADRFTYPHTMAYRNGFFAHVEYEKQVHAYMKRLLARIPNLRRAVRTCFSEIGFRGLYRAYRSEAGNPERDCLHILAVCIAYLENILYNYM